MQQFGGGKNGFKTSNEAIFVRVFGCVALRFVKNKWVNVLTLISRNS